MALPTPVLLYDFGTDFANNAINGSSSALTNETVAAIATPFGADAITGPNAVVQTADTHASASNQAIHSRFDIPGGPLDWSAYETIVLVTAFDGVQTPNNREDYGRGLSPSVWISDRSNASDLFSHHVRIDLQTPQAERKNKIHISPVGTDQISVAGDGLGVLSAVRSIRINSRRFEFGSDTYPLSSRHTYLGLMGFTSANRKGHVIISCDDGLASVYDLFWPLMRERNLPFTCYVNNTTIGVSSNNMTWEQLAEMHDSGLVEIRSHLADGTPLNTLSNVQQAAAIAQCDAALMGSNPLGKVFMTPESRAMAYPQGITTDFAVSELDNLGYLYARTIDNGNSLYSQNYDAPLLGNVPNAGYDPLLMKRRSGDGGVAVGTLIGYLDRAERNRILIDQNFHGFVRNDQTPPSGLFRRLDTVIPYLDELVARRAAGTIDVIGTTRGPQSFSALTGRAFQPLNLAPSTPTNLGTVTPV